MKLLLVGATGLVGSHVLKLALANDKISRVVVLTRRPINITKQAKLKIVNVDFDALPNPAEWWQAGAVICTLGTTMKKAKSKENSDGTITLIEKIIIPEVNTSDLDYEIDFNELDEKYNLSLIRQQSPGLWAERKTFRRTIKNMNIQKKLSKAEGFAKKGKFDEGIKLLTDVVKKFPKQPQAHSLLGMFYIFLKQSQICNIAAVKLQLFDN